ncbi:MAG: hypothetical protein C4532_05165 [Candidatus Abyssobacteria bacterium SURF_17]|uniref:CRISPR system Cms protein Csm4 n=1 Tax=Candidatus Abyssobacteria bacterium SURF_17 TaxID=2093361 RepID=A0A419F355_9BACT|nr:MAG: hypothetical protein C4532_05165 [Candidatus Abyssubacteria bacterium SURF_17]
MSWVVYELLYKTTGPVRIGYHKLGFIQRTRYYIPGRTMWGAATALLTRALHGGATEPGHYQDVGQKLMNKEIFLSYFYPCFLREESSERIIFFPRWIMGDPEWFSAEPSRLAYGSLTESEFEARFIASFGQTAIEPSLFAAEEASLHETEFICDKIRCDSSVQQLYFIGYLFVTGEMPKFDNRDIGWEKGDYRLKEILSTIYVGGDRTYGAGRLRLKQDESGPLRPQGLLFDQYEFDPHSGRIKVPERSPILAHVPCSSEELKGDFEPIVSLEYCEKKGPGQKPTVVSGLHWTPGSLTTKKKSFSIGAYGIWEEYKEERSHG